MVTILRVYTLYLTPSTKERIFLLEKSLENNDSIPNYFRQMMENSVSHHLVNIKWFEGLLKDL